MPLFWLDWFLLKQIQSSKDSERLRNEVLFVGNLDVIVWAIKIVENTNKRSLIIVLHVFAHVFSIIKAVNQNASLQTRKINRIVP